MDEGIAEKCIAAIGKQALGIRSCGVTVAVGSNPKRTTGGLPLFFSVPMYATEEGVAVNDETAGGCTCCV